MNYKEFLETLSGARAYGFRPLITSSHNPRVRLQLRRTLYCPLGAVCRMKEPGMGWIPHRLRWLGRFIDSEPQSVTAAIFWHGPEKEAPRWARLALDLPSDIICKIVDAADQTITNRAVRADLLHTLELQNTT